MLRIKRRRFFELLAKYRKDPDSFSIQYERKTINRKIDPDIELLIFFHKLAYSYKFITPFFTILLTP